MLAELKFLKYKLTNPTLLDYVDMGLGIEARARRCGKFWSKHLALTKEFIASGLEQGVKNKTAAILGAGRLYDVPLECFAGFERVRLIDADPSCRQVWKKQTPEYDSTTFEFETSDVTGSIQRWSNDLTGKVKSKSTALTVPTAAQMLDSLRISAAEGIDEKFDVLISLNLLGQIPIYWRDRVAALLLKHCDLDSDSNGVYPEPLNSSLLASMARLQLDHIQRLSRLASDLLIIISDRFLHYYQNDKAHWQTVPALYFDKWPAFNTFKLTQQDSWLWHIAPQGVEQNDFGVIHEIQAYCYRKL